MIIHCNSCKKSFTVPDNAVTSSGRLVQCSSCGNKWIQYPIQKKSQQKSKVKKNIKPAKRKKRKKTRILILLNIYKKNMVLKS